MGETDDMGEVGEVGDMGDMGDMGGTGLVGWEEAVGPQGGMWWITGMIWIPRRTKWIPPTWNVCRIPLWTPEWIPHRWGGVEGGEAEEVVEEEEEVEEVLEEGVVV